jgi:type VI secretion system protein ImpE
MTPEELLKQGKLDECLAAVEQKIRAAPADPKLRIMLFQVLAVMGQWDRAQNQLQVAAGMNQANLLMAQVCKQAILCEHLRAEVWEGKRSPLILGEPEEWLSWMVQAQAMTAKGQHEAAAELRTKAFEAAPAMAGTITVGDEGQPQPIEWIADADERLGPILEALVDGKYYWIPWHRIALVKIDKPNDLRDTVWLPANFIWTAGGQSVGLIPSRYPGSEGKQFDAAVRLGRRTEFIDDGGFERPVGQRLLATNIGEFGLLEVRSIRLGEGELNPEGGTPGHGGGVGFDSSMKPGGGGGGGGSHG